MMFLLLEKQCWKLMLSSVCPSQLVADSQQFHRAEFWFSGTGNNQNIGDQKSKRLWYHRNILFNQKLIYRKFLKSNKTDYLILFFRLVTLIKNQLIISVNLSLIISTIKCQPDLMSHYFCSIFFSSWSDYLTGMGFIFHCLLLIQKYLAPPKNLYPV